MKVLYIAPEFPNNNENATQVRASQLLVKLAKHVELHVLGFSQDIDGEASIPGLSIKTMPPDKPGLFSVFSSKPRAFYRYAFPESIALFTEMLYQVQPDIVHFDSIATFGLYEVLLGLDLEYSPTIILHPHDAMSRLYASHVDIEDNFLRRVYLRSQLKKIKNVEINMYPKADLCFVDSLDDAELLRSMSGNTHTKVLPLGFDDTVYFPDGSIESVNHPCIVFSGAMGGMQSADAALQLCTKIMPLVWSDKLDVHVYLVGSNPGKELLELQADERIHVTGFVADLAAYLRAADVYACPIRAGSGMRTRILEALACGCPMVAKPAVMQGLSTLDGDHPWIEADSADEFAQEILQLLESRNCEDIGIRAAEFVNSLFSWSGMANQIIESYNKIEDKQ